MIEIALFSAAGFLVAALIALFALPFLTGQAAKAAVQKVRANMPFSAVEISAEKDQLRAEHAVALRKLEIQIEKQAVKISAQNIELNEINEKFSAANQISKAGKLALEEIRSNEIALNDRLRRRDAEYAGLEQRSRRMLRENRDLKLALRKEGKSLNAINADNASGEDDKESTSTQDEMQPQDQASLSAALDKERENTIAANKKVDELQKQLTIALNKFDSSDKKSMRLPEAQVPSILAGKTSDTKNGVNADTIAALQEQILNSAAQIAYVTASIEGGNSKITEILSTSDESGAGSLSSRMKALITQAAKEIPKQSSSNQAQKITEKTPSLPKAKGLPSLGQDYV